MEGDLTERGLGESLAKAVAEAVSLPGLAWNWLVQRGEFDPALNSTLSHREYQRTLFQESLGLPNILAILGRLGIYLLLLQLATLPVMAGVLLVEMATGRAVPEDKCNGLELAVFALVFGFYLYRAYFVD